MACSFKQSGKMKGGDAQPPQSLRALAQLAAKSQEVQALL
jgi:hypothetical protein